MDEPSRGVLVPANRFEVLECRAAIDAVAENAQDTPPLRIGALDVLAQHVLGCACGVPFDADELYAEVTTAAPYAGLTRADFDATIDFVATGGYALKSYERFAKIRQTKDGKWRIAHPRVAQMYRMNVGTIVEADMLKVRLVRSRASKVIPRGGRLLGQVEEYFIETLTPGDTFVFAGEVLKYEALVEDEAYVSRSNDPDPKVPSYEGGKFPLSTYLADRVRGILADHDTWRALPDQVREWLEVQEYRSRLPGMRELLVETFPRAAKYYLICYPFEGRLAHQTLGMLLTRRLERARMRPLGFVANEYALAVWGLRDVAFAVERGELSLDALFDQDMLGDDLEAWLAESALMKRTFRNCAIIAGLIERRYPGRGEEPPPDDDLDRPRLRRAAQAPAGPSAVARGLCGRGLGPARCAARQRDAGAREGAHHPQSARSRLAAGRAGDARDRPRDGLRRGLGRAARRGRSGAHQGGDELSSCFTAIRKLAYAGANTRFRDMGQPSPASHPPDAAAHGRVTVNGVTLAADCLGALYWREEGLLVVADLHLEKGSSFARRGQLLPPYDTTETLARLARLIAHYAPRTVITLGDNFHDRGGPARLSAAGSRLARRAAARARLDLDHRQPRSRSGGRDRRHVRRDAQLGKLKFRHEPSRDAPEGEIAGHLHPVARIAQRGRAVSPPLLCLRRQALVMPAFGAYTGGLNIRDRAFAAVFGARKFSAHMLGEDRLYAFAASRCLSD